MTDADIIPIEQVGTFIRFVRGHKVLMDEDIARLYGVETRILNRAVKRHLDRFPPDFMFQLTLNEYKNLISQFGISRSDAKGHGGRRKPPLVFTEQGVAMLSSVLNSPRAIQVNIAIMRTFVRLREILATNRGIEKKLNQIESKLKDHDKQFDIVFNAIEELTKPTNQPHNRPIGFGRKK
ncbi:MAG: ORF6N domain-containing protein [Myxococcota bacterium]|nr:ORF6N domain-containing protein [Myxococcota bacterium]